MAQLTMPNFQLSDPLQLKSIMTLLCGFRVPPQPCYCASRILGQWLDPLFDQAIRQSAQTQFRFKKLPSITGDLNNLDCPALAKESQSLTDRAFAHVQFFDDVREAERSRGGIKQAIDTADRFRHPQHVQKTGEQGDAFLLKQLV